MLILFLIVFSSIINAIENGRDASEKKWNYSVSIFGKYFCSGTLVTPTVVLTAAHCISASDDDYLISNNKQVANAKLLYVSKRFKNKFINIFGGQATNDFLYDVALLKLDRAINTLHPPNLMSSVQYLDSLKGNLPSNSTLLLGFGKSSKTKLGTRKLFFGDNLSISTLIAPGVFIQSDKYYSGAARKGDSGSALQVIKDKQPVIAAVTSFGTALDSVGRMSIETKYFNEFDRKQGVVAISAFAPVVPSFCDMPGYVVEQVSFDSSKCSEIKIIINSMRSLDYDVAFTTKLYAIHLSSSPERKPSFAEYAINYLRLKSYIAGMPTTSELLNFFYKEKTNYSVEQKRKIDHLIPLVGSKLIENNIINENSFNKWTWKRFRDRLSYFKIKSALTKEGVFDSKISNKISFGFLHPKKFNVLRKVDKYSSAINSYTRNSYPYCFNEVCIEGRKSKNEPTKWVEIDKELSGTSINSTSEKLNLLSLESIICDFSNNRINWASIEKQMIQNGSIRDYISNGETKNHQFLLMQNKEATSNKFTFNKFNDGSYEMDLSVNMEVNEFRNKYQDKLKLMGFYFEQHKDKYAMSWNSGVKIKLKNKRSITIKIISSKASKSTYFSFYSSQTNRQINHIDRITNLLFSCDKVLQ